MAVALQPVQEVKTIKRIPTKQRRVVVTGMGVVTPLGHDLDVFYNNLLDGASGISEIETFDCAEYPTVFCISFQLHILMLLCCSFCSLCFFVSRGLLGR